MHNEILSDQQVEVLPFVKKYKKKFYLVGGTAIALHMGHRRSIDFDLFTNNSINFTAIKKDLSVMPFSKQLIVQLKDQVHFIVNGVKLTFFEFPFDIECSTNFEGYFQMPDLITLSAMKAFALNGRGKWKDYVDLYFIIKDHYTVTEISTKAKEVFNDVFNPILFRKQLCYFNDINYSEQVEFLPGFETDEQTIQRFLTEAALAGF